MLQPSRRILWGVTLLFQQDKPGSVPGFPGVAADISFGTDSCRKSENMPTEEHGGRDESPTTSLDADRPKRLGGRVMADPVNQQQKGDSK